MLKDPGGWGWAGPGAPWRGLGRELQPFHALCVPGAHFHSYRKGFLPPLTKLVFSCLIRERARHTMSPRPGMWRRVRRKGPCSHLAARVAGCSPERSLSGALPATQGPAPCVSPGSGHGGLACAQDSGLRFIPATGWVPQKASPVKLKLRSHCVFSLLVAFCPGRIHNLHFL